MGKLNRIICAVLLAVGSMAILDLVFISAEKKTLASAEELVSGIGAGQISSKGFADWYRQQNENTENAAPHIRKAVDALTEREKGQLFSVFTMVRTGDYHRIKENSIIKTQRIQYAVKHIKEATEFENYVLPLYSNAGWNSGHPARDLSNMKTAVIIVLYANMAEVVQGDMSGLNSAIEDALRLPELVEKYPRRVGLMTASSARSVVFRYLEWVISKGVSKEQARDIFKILKNAEAGVRKTSDISWELAVGVEALLASRSLALPEWIKDDGMVNAFDRVARKFEDTQDIEEYAELCATLGNLHDIGDWPFCLEACEDALNEIEKWAESAWINRQVADDLLIPYIGAVRSAAIPVRQFRALGVAAMISAGVSKQEIDPNGDVMIDPVSGNPLEIIHSGNNISIVVDGIEGEILNVQINGD